MPINQPKSIRPGEPWTEEDYTRFVEELRNGRPLEDIAVLLHWTAGPLKGRLRRLIPLEVQDSLKPAEREFWGREALNAPAGSYDWIATLRETYAAYREHFWSNADVTLLRERWATSESLPTIAEEPGVSEVSAAQQLP